MRPPYQPSLLRLLHGATALLVLMAWLSGAMVLFHHDGRWGRLPLPPGADWIDIHGSIAVLLWPMALLFGLYALSLGRARLRRPSSAVALVALALAVGTGKWMQEDWLRQGQLDQFVYSGHLLAWLALTLAVATHLAGVLRQGGWPLAGSMLSLQLQPNDRPRHWPRQLSRWFGAGS